MFVNHRLVCCVFCVIVIVYYLAMQEEIKEIEDDTVKKCSLCECSFTTSSSLRRHGQKIHKNQTDVVKSTNKLQNHAKNYRESPEKETTLKKETLKKCPLCNYSHVSKDMLLDHFVDNHKILMVSQDLELKNNEFIKWKTDLENSTNAKFVVEYTRKSKKYITKNYVCHRSSIYTSEGNGRKHLKNEPNFKIDGFCPASFKVNQDSETSKIHHISTHVGHDTNNSVSLLSEQALVSNKVKKPVSCQICKIPFSKVANLRAHIKRKHPGKLDILCPKKIYAAVVSCNECSKTFVNHSNLRTHMKRAHKEKEQQSRKIQCLKCALCQYNAGKQNILTHYDQSHGILMDIEYKEFSSLGEFESWKTNIEAETVASFVSHHGSYNTKNSKKRMFECHRSGQFVSKSTGARQLKTQGSNKINGYCPAHIRVEVIDGKCKVKFCKTHVGHEQDLRHLFLTTAQRQEIAAKIAEKIPLSSILEEIKSSGAANGKLERLHLLKKKDLYNIERCFQLHTSTAQANEGYNNLSPNDIEDDRTFQVEEVAIAESLGEPTDQSTDLLEQQKAALSAGLLQQINSVTTQEELEVLKKLIAPILPNLNLQNYAKETKKTHTNVSPHNVISQNVCQNNSVNIQSVTNTNGLITLQIFDKT